MRRALGEGARGRVRDELQIDRVNDPIARHDEGVLHSVLELADVARPAMREELRLGLRREVRRGKSGLRHVGREKVASQRQDIAGTIAERRDVDVRDVEAIEEIFAKATLADGLGQAGVGGRDEAHVDGHGAPRPDAHHLALLQHAEELDLRRQG